MIDQVRYACWQVENLKSKLLENLEQFLGELDLSKEITGMGSRESTNEGSESDSIPCVPEVITNT